jgi:Lysine methyltransferase
MAKRCRAQVPTVLTDVPEALPALWRNSTMNADLAGRVRVAALDWRAPSQHFDSARGAFLHPLRTAVGAGPPGCSMVAQSLPALAWTTAAHAGASTVQCGGVQATARAAQSAAAGCAGDDGERSAGCSMQHAQQAYRDEVKLPGGRGVILAADCVWLMELVTPFVATLAHVCRGIGDAVVVMAYKSRSSAVDVHLAECLLEHGFTCELAPVCSGETRGTVLVWQVSCSATTLHGKQT